MECGHVYRKGDMCITYDIICMQLKVDSSKQFQLECQFHHVCFIMIQVLYLVNSAVHRSLTWENIHPLITIKHNDVQAL